MNMPEPARVARTYVLACLLVPMGIAANGARAEDAPATLHATGAATFGDLSAGLALVELRASVAPRLDVSAGIGYFAAGHGYEEMQLRAAATARFGVAGWRVDDRNMVSLSSESVERYRNRLRLISPPFSARLPVSVQAYDELTFDFDRGRIVRNNLALGFGAPLGDCCRMELYQVWSDNRGSEDTRYLLAVLSASIVP